MKIQGTNVLITGGCGGIGRAIAERFANAGLHVVLVDKVLAGADELRRRYPAIEAIELDLGDSAAIDGMLRPHFEIDAAPDILVNAVGVSPKGPSSGTAWRTWEMPLEQWQHVLDVNLTAYFCCSRLALSSMVKRRRGRIISIASLAARTGGYVAPAHYVASKAAVLGLTKVMAKEAAPFGITVNAINPGRIDTPMIHDVPDEMNETYVKRIPLGRLGRPEDIAGVALFLASDLADYLTGATIEANGGLYMGP